MYSAVSQSGGLSYFPPPKKKKNIAQQILAAQTFKTFLTLVVRSKSKRLTNWWRFSRPILPPPPLINSLKNSYVMLCAKNYLVKNVHIYRL